MEGVEEHNKLDIFIRFQIHDWMIGLSCCRCSNILYFTEAANFSFKSASRISKATTFAYRAVVGEFMTLATHISSLSVLSAVK